MSRVRRRSCCCAVVVLLAAACAGSSEATGDASTSGAASTTDPAGTTGAEGTTGGGSTDTGETTTTGLCDTDGGELPTTTIAPDECDVFTDAGCASDERCRFKQVDPGCLGFCDQAYVCVPMAQDPGAADDRCTRVDDQDDCGPRLTCVDGFCTPMCGGCAAAPTCDAPRGVCVASDQPYCVVRCDPLAPDCPDASPLCTLGSGFSCQHPTGAVIPELYDPCVYPDQCASGLYCGASPACDSEFCCLAVCDIFKPNSCPTAGEVCTNVFGNEPSLLHRGLCLPA